MRTLLVIGIGVGDPAHLTLQAVEAIGSAGAFVVIDKGESKDELLALRRHLLAAHARPGHRVVTIADPDRDRTPASYGDAVRDWHAERADLLQEALVTQTSEDDTVAMLVWGDPSLFDSTLRLVEVMTLPLTVKVTAGLTSVQVLTAAHGIVLNRVGQPVLITTGRRLREGWPPGVEDVVVMLDADCSWADLDEPLDLWWGAWLGSKHEVLISGDAHEVLDEVRAVRERGRAEHGWIMDVYLLRRR